MGFSLQHKDKTLIVHLSGFIDFSLVEKLEFITLLQKKLPYLKIDFKKLKFVGSIGICDFIKALEDLNTAWLDQMSLINVSSEFQSVLEKKLQHKIVTERDKKELTPTEM